MSFIPDIKKRIGIAVASFILMSGTTYTVKAHPSIKKLPGLEVKYGYDSQGENKKITSKQNEEKIENKVVRSEKIIDSGLDDKANKEKDIQNVENNKELNKIEDKTSKAEENNKQDDNKKVSDKNSKKEHVNTKSEKDGLYKVQIKTLKEKDDSDSMAGGYIKKANYEVKNGKKYLMLSLDSIDWMKNITITVDGQEITPTLTDVVQKENNDNKGIKKGKIKVEIGSLDSKIMMHMNVVPMGNARVAFRIILDKDTLKPIINNTKPSSEVKPNEDGKPINAIEKPDGINKPTGQMENPQVNGNVNGKSSEKPNEEWGEVSKVPKFKDGTIENSQYRIKVYGDPEDDYSSVVTDVIVNGVKYYLDKLQYGFHYYGLALAPDAFNKDKNEIIIKAKGYNDTKIIVDKDGKVLSQQEKKGTVGNANVKLEDGVYTVHFSALRADNPNVSSMLQGFFDKNVRLDVKDGKMKLTLLNIYYAYMLFDFRIENNGIYEEPIIKANGIPDFEGQYSRQTFEIPIEDLGKEHEAGVLVRAMGGQKEHIGNIDKYTKLKIVFHKDIQKGWDGYLTKEEVKKDSNEIFTEALMKAGLDKDLDGKISDEEFKNVTGEIKLINTKIDDITMLKKLGSGVTSLKLDQNKISKLPKGIFDNLTNLESLTLSANEIKELPEGIFDKLTKLKNLDISQNNIDKLPDNVFNKLTLLEGLYLDGNNLRTIPKNISNLKKIKSLTLNENKIEVLPNELGELTKLDFLNLAQNRIKNIPCGLFDKLENLRLLYLFDNQIENIPKNIDEILPKIKKFDLYLNKLGNIPDLVHHDIAYYPQKNEMNLKLTAKDGKLTWNQDLSVLDIICWAGTVDPAEKFPENIDEYKKHLNGKKVEDFLNERYYDWTIITEIQKKDSKGKYITLKTLTTEEEPDKLEESLSDLDMKNGDSYKLVKKILARTTGKKTLFLSDIAYAVAEENHTQSTEGNKQDKDKLYEIQIKSLKENSDEASMAGGYIEKVNYEVKNGKQYLICSLDSIDWMSNITATVDGKDINIVPGNLVEKQNENDGKGKKKGKIKFEIGSLDSKIIMHMNVQPMGNARVAFRIIPQKDTLKLVDETIKPTEQPVKPIELEDGKYSIKTSIICVDKENERIINENLKISTKLEIKNKEIFVTLNLKGKYSNNIEILVDGKPLTERSELVRAKKLMAAKLLATPMESESKEIKFKIPSLDSKIEIVAKDDSIKDVKFAIKLDKDSIKLSTGEVKPKEDNKPVVKPVETGKSIVKEISVNVLKENSNEPSMAGEYLNKNVTYKEQNGKKYFTVTLDRMDWMKNIAISVDGREVTYNKKESGLKADITFEVGSENSEVTLHMNVVPMGNARVGFRIVNANSTQSTKPVIKPEENKIADGVYTVGFGAYKLDNPTDSSMLTNFFDEKVKLEVKDGKLRLTFLNTCFANGLYDFRIGSNGVYPESIAKGYGKVNKEGQYEYQTFQIPISDLESEHIGCVLVGPMGALKTDFGNMDKYKKVKFVFNKELIKGWNGFDKDKQVVNEDKQFNKALIRAGLDKNGDGIVSDDELAMAEGEVELSRGGIKDISRLKNLGNKVTALYLVGNEISELPEGIFDNLINLQKLYIDGNEIEKLPQGIFDKLTQLSELQLGSNDIKELPNGIFDKLTNLKSLSLSDNPFNKIDSDVFDKLEKLSFLSLGNTKLKTIPDKIFNLANLDWLILSNNEITKVPKELSKLDKLTWLDLGSNYIEELPTEIYAKLKKLKNFYINDNLIKEIPKNILELLPNITDCNIEFNKLNDIPKSAGNKMMFKCPQKTPMKLELIVQDGKITWKQSLNGVDLITWKKTTSPYSKEGVPKNIDEYKKHLSGKTPLQLLNDKECEPKIITLIQKKDNDGKYITLKEIISDNENDTVGVCNDSNMKIGDQYRIVKKGYVTSYAVQDYVFTDVAYATAKKVDIVPEVNQKQFKIKVLKENSDEESMAKEYLNENIIYREKDGKKFFVVTLNKIDWMKNINVYVDGKDVKYDKNKLDPKAELTFEVGSENSEVKLSMNVEPMGNARVSFRIKINKNSIEDQVKPSKPSTSGGSSGSSSGSTSASTTPKKGDMSQDGLYRLEIKVLKEKDDSDSMAGEYLGGRANVEVRGKNKYLILTFNRSEWMTNIDIDVDGSSERYDVVEETTDSNGQKTKTIKFKILDVDSKITVHMNVQPMGNARVAFRVVPQKNSATYDGKKYKSNSGSSTSTSTSSSTSTTAKTNINKTNIDMNKDGLYEINTKFKNEYYDEQQVINKYLDNKAYIEVKGNKKYIIVPIKIGKDKWSKDIKNINIVVDGNKTNYEVVDEKTNSIKFEIPKVDSKIAINMKAEPMKDTEIKFNIIPDNTTTKLIEEYNNTSNAKEDSTSAKNNTNKDVSKIKNNKNTSTKNKNTSKNKKKSEVNKQSGNVSSYDETSKLEENKLPQTGLPIGMGGMAAMGALLATLGFTLRKKDNQK